jgi:class 3 adenylate cyclase
LGTAADFRNLVLVAVRELQQIAIERRAKVEEFQRKHRVGLLTLLFTDIVGSTKLKQQEHDEAGKARDLYGIQIDIQCARVQSLGEADQILLTRFPFDAARQALRGEDLDGVDPLSWVNHGPYLLKGIEEPIEICEVGELGRAKLGRPPDTEKAHRFISADNEPVLGWRPAVGLVC